MKKFVLGMSFAALLTGVVSASGSNNVAHAADKKLWDPIPKYMQKGETDLNRGYYYDFGDVTDKEVSSKVLLYLGQHFPLYDKVHGNPTGAWLNPQTVEVLSVTEVLNAYFIEINTWQGPKWIKWTDVSFNSTLPIVKVKYPVNGDGSSIFKSVSNKTEVPIYKSPGNNAVVEAYISPQDLKVSSVGLGDYIHPEYEGTVQNGYIGIQTWLGERWVKANDIDTEVMGRYIYPVTTSNVFALQDKPERITGFKSGIPHIAAQKVYAIQRKGPFVQIKTWLGDKWIEADEYIDDLHDNDSYKAEATPVQINENSNLYDRPDYQSDKFSATNTQLYELTGTFKKENGEVWYYVKNGNWVPASEVEPMIDTTGVFESKEDRMLFTLYKSYLGNSYMVNPQPLQFKKKLGDLYLVDTWLGERWVQKQNDDQVTFNEKDFTLQSTAKLYKKPVKADSVEVGDVTAQVVKEVARISWNGQNWIQVKVPATNQEGWILEV
ncbi:hypothetical protein [Bacillus bombysepticus]|uniref:hypothetical protein n=1 Tax=Bacillus bombysepticus TaxID=658666 RepID=UPI003018102E